MKDRRPQQRHLPADQQAPPGAWRADRVLSGRQILRRVSSHIRSADPDVHSGKVCRCTRDLAVPADRLGSQVFPISVPVSRECERLARRAQAGKRRLPDALAASRLGYYREALSVYEIGLIRELSGAKRHLFVQERQIHITCEQAVPVQTRCISWKWRRPLTYGHDSRIPLSPNRPRTE
jgi:hypothetical protein